MAPLPKRVLISITSAVGELLDHHPTGLFIGEALHPWIVFTAAGYEVDFASEKGSYGADWQSLLPDFLNGESLKLWEDTNSAFRKSLDNMPKAADVDGNKYGIFFASAGYPALIDYPTATGLHRIAQTVWDNGGIVSSVCHGPAIFGGIKDKATGNSIIHGRTITGFTDEAEEESGVLPILRSWNVLLVSEWAAKLGATYKRPAGNWDDYHIVDGRVVTGTQPQSASSTAKAVVEEFEKLG